MIINVYQNDQRIEVFDLGDLISSDFVDHFTFLVGRSDECRIQLPDKKVSRNHCEVLYKNKKWSLRKNAKFAELNLNGHAINESEIKNGDVAKIGPYQLIFELGDKSEVANDADVVNHSVESVSDEKDLLGAGDDGTNLPTGDDLDYPEIDESDNTTQSTEVDGESLDSLDESEEVSLSDDTGESEEYGEYDSENYDGDSDFSDDDEESEYEDFGDESYPVEESAGEKTQVFTGFADYDLEIFGEFAPYDKFSIPDGESFIGREEGSVDIYLADSEVSSKHAKIIKSKISLRLVDLNSANGTLLNGSRINESDLTSGDEFIIGSTTFTVHIRSDMIKNEKDRLLPVEENQVVEVEEVVEVDDETVGFDDSVTEEEAPKSLIGKFRKLPPKKQKIYGAVALLFLYVMLDSEEPETVNVPGKKPTAKNKQVSADGTPVVKKAIIDNLEKLTLQEREVVASKYQLAFEFIQQGKYTESLSELDYVMKLAPEYKQARSLYQMAREGLAKLEELEQKRIKEIEAKKRQDRVNSLLEKAQKYVKERQVQAAEGIFSKILEIDPENFDVPQLKLEINAWKKEQERIAMEKAQKDADRKRKLNQIAPSRTFFGKEEWYKAILKVEEFLRIKNMDEDLVKEATAMLKESKNNLRKKIDPMIGKARSLKEGQDLKAAYEQYLDILNFEPTNTEALDEMNDIRDVLTMRSQKVYRDGLISESLMLFKEAKEKFQEVQQISPSDSEYYKKASLKLREYLE